MDEPVAPGGRTPRSLYGEELAPGARVGGFLVEEVRHRGVVAVLYRGRADGSSAPVALKVMRPQYASSESALRRFGQECQMLEQLAHPHIVRVLESGDLRDGRPWLAMEWLEGRDLEAELAARGPFPPHEALRILEPVAAALGAAHALGIVHRDIKTQNVMVRAGEGGAPHVTLVDFGIAKLLDPGRRSTALTSTGVTVGTPVAMAPEQILQGPVDKRTDIYGVGVLLYQLLTGRLPFRASSQAELEELHLHAPPPSPSHLAPVPTALDAVVRRCLAKRPDDRYPDAEVLIEELRRALAPSAGPVGKRRWGSGCTCVPGPRPERMPTTPRSKRSIGRSMPLGTDSPGADWLSSSRVRTSCWPLHLSPRMRRPRAPGGERRSRRSGRCGRSWSGMGPGRDCTSKRRCT